MTTYLYLISSFFLLFVCVWIYRKSTPQIGYTITLSIAVFGSVFLQVTYLVADYFTAEGINEAVLYHLRYGLDGAGLLEYSSISIVALISLVAGVGVLLWLMFGAKIVVAGAFARRAAFVRISALACIGVSLALNPAMADLYKLVVIGGVTHPRTFLESHRETDHKDGVLDAEFKKYYASSQLTPMGQHSRNLVFIYAESLERTYFDEKTFPGLITGLRRLEGQAISFTDIVQAPGTGWTIAGMVASQCGIPLLTPSHGNSMSGLDRFLPSAVCLGDLLKHEGYYLTYYGGANLKFAGKGNFYKTHQFDEVAGRGELLYRLQDKKYINHWGLYDDSLLDIAYDRYSELAQSREKFGLFLVTLDTHHPNGHMSEKCKNMRYQDGKNPILNAVMCSDYLLAEFIARIQQSPWGKDTVIVLASDHLAMKNSAYEILEKQPRRNVFIVFEPARNKGMRMTATGSSMDIGTTLLPFLGYRGQIGLGRDLMNPTIQSDVKAEYVRKHLSAWSEPVSRFWGFPKIEKYLEVDAVQRTVTIDERRFSLPLFIEIDGDMETVLKFPRHMSVLDFVHQNGADNKERAFILLSECTAKDPRLPMGKTCLFAGRSGKFLTQMIVHRTARFSAGEIRRMTSHLGQ